MKSLNQGPESKAKMHPCGFCMLGNNVPYKQVPTWLFLNIGPTKPVEVNAESKMCIPFLEGRKKKMCQVSAGGAI